MANATGLWIAQIPNVQAVLHHGHQRRGLAIAGKQLVIQLFCRAAKVSDLPAADHIRAAVRITGQPLNEHIGQQCAQSQEVPAVAFIRQSLGNAHAAALEAGP